MKTVVRDGARTADVTTAGTYVISGTELTRSDSCPGTQTHVIGFTAAPGSFIAYEAQGAGKWVELVYEPG